MMTEYIKRPGRGSASFTVVPFSKLVTRVLQTVNMWYLILLLSLSMVTCDPFKTVFSWKQVDYNFPNETTRNAYKTSGDYIKEHVVPLGLNVWGDKLFITIPRWKKGVPANLNYVSLNNDNKSPLLNPYPDWESNDIHSPDALVNILRVRIDACDRLWAVDSGIDDILGEFNAVQPKKLIAIDLKTNKIILRYTFKDSDLKPNTFFADTVIDVDPKNCSDAYVYNSDLGGYGLVVYSMAKNDSWRINHNYFYFDPLNGEYNVSGIHFQWTDGMFGMALSPPKEDGSKTLYFHPMSGIHEFAVSTSLIKNQTALADPKYWTQFYVVGNKGPLTQGTSSMYDLETGIIYFTQLNKNAVACWDTKMDLNPDNFRIVAQDNEKLVFPNDIIIEPKTRKFYCLSDNLPVLQYSEYDVNQTNFYIHVASLDDLTTACRAKAE
ncbi:protein yellow-like isoform X2 [Cotesia glomerata]|uniref:protein yellow-like isoform X2 n=1 Tax=Cotesia glomerata TaxID=32391 RepID=UPI001D01243E|nr:protein yellow-like isoform X2 [Cotesia glomerata]